MARTTTGIDIGSKTVQLLRGQYKGNTFHATHFTAATNEGGDLDGGWEACEPDFKPSTARIGLTGREVNLRYTRVPRVPDWQLRKLMRFEVEEIGDQSGSEVASDFNLLPELPEIEGEDVVVLAMARESLLEEHMHGLAGLGAGLDAFAPNALALYNAWLRYGVIEGDTVLVANIGHENVDVVICRGPDLVFARNLSGGSALFDRAIADRFDISLSQAEGVKKNHASVAPGASFDNASAEKASRACSAPAGQLSSLLQSTLMFCKSQLKIPGLKIDRVMLCGGGAALDGLPEWLQSAMGVPVERFDPFRVVDTSALDAEDAEELERHKLESVVALGLATMGSDPEGYSVEILPAKVRRTREFWGGTAFLVAAGLLAVLFLGWDAWNDSQSLDALREQKGGLASRLRSAEATDRDTRALLEENTELAAISSDLMAALGCGEQIARALEVLDSKLPEEFWLSRLESTWSFDDELGVDRALERPILRIEGRAREGTRSMAQLHETFLASLRDGLPGARLKAAPSADGTRFEVDLTLLAAPEAVEDEEN
ncbi:MAG: pilus assembly protein PilM [Planctomycetota bacterium]|jgi:Tfp pilus assembly PilM family ATPase|nr:pilus assembly protein PilM [Planctomycetota bacterium]